MATSGFVQTQSVNLPRTDEYMRTEFTSVEVNKVNAIELILNTFLRKNVNNL